MELCSVAFLGTPLPLKFYGQCQTRTEAFVPFRSRKKSRPRLFPVANASRPDEARNRQPSLFEPNEQVNSYQIKRLLGRGSNGITYEASSSEHRDALALKALPFSALASWKTLDLFEREARTLKTLSHPLIPSYVDFFQLDRGNDTIFVLVQKKASGASIQQLVDDGHRFSTEQVSLVFEKLLEVLCYLASLNPPVLHRDIKPSNVILDLRTNQVSLVDFGGVNTGSPGSTLVGTFGYMPPEQFSGSGDVRSDLYAVAATILYTITGRSPASLPQTRLKIDVEEVLPAPERLKLGNIYTVMTKLLEPAPEDRYKSPQAALDALTTKASEQGSLWSGNTLSAEEAASLTQAFNGMSPAKNGTLQKISGWARGMRRKPVGSRVLLERDAGNRLLRISVPPKGISSESISQGAFTVVWTGFTAFWTVGVLTSGAPLLLGMFSIPFWAAGVRMARATVEDVVGGSTLVVSCGGGEKEVFYFGLTAKGAFGRENVIEGDPRDMGRAVLETSMVVNGEAVTELVISEGTRRHVIGKGLAPVEQEWLRGEINDFLGSQRRW